MAMPWSADLIVPCNLVNIDGERGRKSLNDPFSHLDRLAFHLHQQAVLLEKASWIKVAGL